MLAFISWYLVLSLAGWLAFPLAYRLAPALADRGYAFSRALGLLLWSYGFWLLCSLGILRNSPGGVLVSLGLVLGMSIWALRSTDLDEFKTWILSRQRMIVVSEILFLVAFAGWAVVRVANPEASGTEKPMELAFINAIIHSPAFPPHDPWLSGYAISYYYFGYVMIALLAMLTNTSAAIAFNLGSALVFGLERAGQLTVWSTTCCKPITAHKNPGRQACTHPGYSRMRCLGPLFLLIVSNLEGFLHSLHARGLFWTRDGSGVWSSGFWKWLDLSRPERCAMSSHLSGFQQISGGGGGHRG